MANEIRFKHDAKDKDLYFVAWKPYTGEHWNTDGTPDWESLTVANWSDYVIAMAETPANSRLYVGSMPAVAGNMEAGWYFVEIYERTGATANIDDDTMLAQMLGYWDGTTFRLHETDTQAECEAAIDAKGFLLQSADTGATAVARTGADSDTLETLSNQIDALPGAVAANTFNDQTYNTVGYTLTAGTLVSGTSADTLTVGTPLVFAPTAIAALDVDFEFELGTARVNELVVTGYYEGTTGVATSRYASVYLWDYLAATPAWVLITDGSNRIPDGGSNVVMRYAIPPQYQDPSTGQVKVRYVSSRTNANDRLYIDQHFVNGVNIGHTLDEIANAIAYYQLDSMIAQDAEHQRLGWFLWVQRPVVSGIANVTGDVVTGVAGTRFEAVDNLYVGHPIQFHLGGTNQYRWARITSQTGVALTLDAMPADVTDDWHFYVLPERTITLAEVAINQEEIIKNTEIIEPMDLSEVSQ